MYADIYVTVIISGVSGGTASILGAELLLLTYFSLSFFYFYFLQLNTDSNVKLD